MAERLQKLISAAGLASRRAAEALITAGRVTVNGRTARLGETADRETDTVCVDGKPLRFAGTHTYILLNKPRNVLSAVRDDRGRPTAADLVRAAGVRVYPAGRLDWDSDGLLLLTDDGALTHALTHPAHEVDKVYRVVVEGDAAAALPVLTGPMAVDGVPIRPASGRLTAPDTLELTIHEGRNRQIRKMCAQAGLTVRRLTRIAEGPLRLDNGLAPGAWRYLTENEIAALKNLTAGEPSPKNPENPEKF